MPPSIIIVYGCCSCCMYLAYFCYMKNILTILLFYLFLFLDISDSFYYFFRDNFILIFVLQFGRLIYKKKTKITNLETRKASGKVKKTRAVRSVYSNYEENVSDISFLVVNIICYSELQVGKKPRPHYCLNHEQ